MSVYGNSISIGQIYYGGVRVPQSTLKILASLQELESYLTSKRAKLSMENGAPVLEITEAGGRNKSADYVCVYGKLIFIRMNTIEPVSIERRSEHVDLLSHSSEVRIPLQLINELILAGRFAPKDAALATAAQSSAPQAVQSDPALISSLEGVSASISTSKKVQNIVEHYQHYKGNDVKAIGSVFRGNVYVECEPVKGRCTIDLTGSVLEKDLYIVDSPKAIQKAKEEGLTISVSPPTFNFPNISYAQSLPMNGARGRIDGVFHICQNFTYHEGVEARIIGGRIKGNVVFQNCKGWLTHEAPPGAIEGKIVNGIEEVD